MNSKDRKAAEKLLWSITHKDFRGILDGQKSVLMFDPKYGTVTKIISDFTDSELIARLGSRWPK